MLNSIFKKVLKKVCQGRIFLGENIKFETSGRPIRLNLFNEKYFLLEGYTRPLKKSAKGTSHGSGIYHCIIVYSMKDGQILMARDYSCLAGKRGFCKHVAALAYKLADYIVSKRENLPSTLTCT